MHTVKSLTLIFLFSLLLMSHLYKELSCESVVHKVDNGLEDIFDEKQLPDMTKNDSKHEILIRLGLSRGPLHKVYITGQDTTPGKSVHVENDGTESKQESMSDLFQISKEEFMRYASSERKHQDTTPGKSVHVEDDGPESKQESMSDLFQMSKEEFMIHAPSERKRRDSAGQQHAGSECQRHNMYVNFTKLGWNKFVVAPPGYDAYYCAGECSLAQTIALDSTKHSHLQALMNGYNSQISKPCCVPTKLSSLELIYIDNSSIHNEQWSEMIVETCGCL